MKKDEVYLKDMLDAVDQILEYCKGFDYIKSCQHQACARRRHEKLGDFR